jgi:hypothetical protein
VVKQAEGFLSELTVGFIERPGYRLAGADEALAQLGDRAKRTADELEDARAALAREVAEGYGKALAAIGGLRGGPLGPRRAAPGELAEAVGGYARARLRQLLADAALGVYRAVANGLPDFKLAVADCRAALRRLAAPLAPPAEAYDPGPATPVLPDGCDTPEAAAERVVGRLTPDELQGFEDELQAAVRRQFRGLANVCQKADKQPAFVALLTDAARRLLDARVEAADPATVLLRVRGDGEPTARLLREGFAKAAPDLAGWDRPPAEAVLLAAPAGPAGDRVRQLATEACPDLAFDTLPLADDILVYRECPKAPLDRLPHLGPHARDAYLAQLGTDHPPHARRDVPPPEQ